MHRPAPLAVGIGVLAALAAAPVGAQQASGAPTLRERPRYAAALLAGVSQFDLSGTGTTGIVGARVEAEVRRWLVAEGALGFFRPVEQFGGRSRYTIPEAQLQVQFPGRAVRPYLGAGGGYVFASGGRGTQGTASGAAGLRLALPGAPIDARGELRVRGIGRSFTGSTAEWTLGLGYRF
jgi:hypothetical protein